MTNQYFKLGLVALLLILLPGVDAELSLFTDYTSVSAAPLTAREKAAKKRAEEKEKAAKKRAKIQKRKSRVTMPTESVNTADSMAVFHSLDYHAGVGYANLINNIPNSRTPGGVGANAGLSYELNCRKWIVQAGLEFEWLNSTTGIEPYTHTTQYFYLPQAGYILDYPSEFSNIHRVEHVGLVHVPLMAGYQFTPLFYGLVGIKMGVGVFAKDQTSWEQYTCLVDKELIGELNAGQTGELHNVGHRTGTTNGVAKTNWKAGFNLAPAIELGVTIRDNYRLGLFAEYGVLDISEDQVFADRVNPLYTGLRFTGRIPLAKTAQRVKPVKEPKPKPQPQPQSQPEPEPESEVIIFQNQQIEVDKPVVLDNLLFVFDQAAIIPESMASLNNLLQLMRERTDIHVHITGHTDAKGTDEYNMRLSVNRAKAVCDYLIEHGIAPDRLTFEGRGAREPIDTNDTEEGRQRNRRVEFTIINQQ